MSDKDNITPLAVTDRQVTLDISDYKTLKTAYMSDTESTETVERYDTGASMSVTLNRGTSTRDEDKWTLKGKGRNAQEAIGELETQLDELEAELADRVRNLQPEVGDE